MASPSYEEQCRIIPQERRDCGWNGIDQLTCEVTKLVKLKYDFIFRHTVAATTPITTPVFTPVKV